MTETKYESSKLRIFLCHAREDQPIVKELFEALKYEVWIDLWLEKENNFSSQNWQAFTERAVDEADAIIVCISNHSVTSDGYIQKEIRYVYDLALQKPEGSISLILLRLDDVSAIPRRLVSFNWMDYFGDQKQNEYFKLLEALRQQFERKKLPVSTETMDLNQEKNKRPTFTDLGSYEHTMIIKKSGQKNTQKPAVKPEQDQVNSSVSLGATDFLEQNKQENNNRPAAIERPTMMIQVKKNTQKPDLKFGQKQVSSSVSSQGSVKAQITTEEGRQIALKRIAEAKRTRAPKLDLSGLELETLAGIIENNFDLTTWLSMSNRPLRILLCHAWVDKPIVQELYKTLKSENWIETYFDMEKIPLEQDWQAVIKQAVDEADAIIVCLSNQSVTSEGYVQKEVRYAYDLALQKPEGSTFLIPLRLDEISFIPRRLSAFRWVDYFGDQKQDECITLLTALRLQYEQKNLDLSHNQLFTLVEEIGGLVNLTSLDLSYNKIESLPSKILGLNNLKALWLDNNPLPIPPEILEKAQQPQVVLEYYFSHLKKTLNECKVLVVGQGSVGKTSLIQQLIAGKFNPAENKTEGIVITQWQVEDGQFEAKSSQSKINLNIWDFGGQEIMHATHQFFLTKRSLYLLILDSRLTQEENRVEYWLKIIQSFGGNSPVLMVGNKTDQHPLDIDRSGLQKKYPNIVGILETSAATGAGIEELKNAIAEQVNHLPHVRDLLPETWFIVKTKLEGLGHKSNFITHDKYLELCIENEIKDETSQRMLIGFLHDLGVVLHFQDDPRLEALGILNPQWVTNGVYKILNSHALFQNKGVLERSMLADILPEDDYPANKRLFIVDMMRKFELCYDIVPELTFLVPDLLPKDEPFTGEWEGALAFQYHYNVLPSSIISRFIVRMNEFIHKTVWRSGVILKKDGNTTLVKADMEDRKIFIWVNGDEPTRRDFLSAIRMEFDAIHKTIIKIEATQKVPHPQYSNLVLDYAELIQFELDGISEFPRSVDSKTIMVTVEELLNGVRVGVAPDPQTSLKQGVETPKVESLPEKTEPTTGKQPLLVGILSAIFVSIPRVIGRFALDIFGRDKALDSTAILLGYVLIVLSVLAVWGIVDVNSLRDWFAGWWRFFFPVK